MGKLGSGWLLLVSDRVTGKERVRPEIWTGGELVVG